MGLFLLLILIIVVIAAKAWDNHATKKTYEDYKKQTGHAWADRPKRTWDEP